MAVSVSVFRLSARNSVVSKTLSSQTDVKQVNTAISDDILRRLAPGLKPYFGCDIIDINPGICLWSSKLHELLRPRRHILVEPQEDLYKSWIRPLVDVSDTRYQLARFEGREFPWDFQHYLEKGLLPRQENGKAASMGGKVERKLLILANLSRHTRSSSGMITAGKRLEPQQKIFEFTRSIEKNSGFHSYGTTRMLAWMVDEEKTHVLPRTVTLRRRLSVASERFCHVEEIAGGRQLSHGARRETSIELESFIATAKRMRLNGICIPSSRLDEMPRRLREDGEEALLEFMRASDTAGTRDWQRELFELRKAFDSGQYSQFVGGLPGWDVSRRASGGKKVTPEFERFRALERANKGQQKVKAAIDDILRHNDEIRKLDLAISADTSLDGQNKLDRLQDLNVMVARYKKLLRRQPKHRISQVLFFADDRAAWDPDRPLLMWDRRSAEPIIAHTDEFHGPRSLALLDFEPRSTSHSPLTDVQQNYLDAMLLVIFASPSDSIVDALNRVAPGAADALIPQAPSLQDPQRGGCSCADQLRVRLLTMEMIRELAVAWEQWKFKPTLGELLRSSPRYLAREI